MRRGCAALIPSYIGESLSCDARLWLTWMCHQLLKPQGNDTNPALVLFVERYMYGTFFDVDFVCSKERGVWRDKVQHLDCIIDLHKVPENRKWQRVESFLQPGVRVVSVRLVKTECACCVKV